MRFDLLVDLLGDPGVPWTATEGWLRKLLDPAVVDRLAGLLSGHVARCRRALEAGTPA